MAKAKIPCSVDGCKGKHMARGLCGRHYSHWLQEADERPRCSVSGCDRAAFIKGLCNKHYCRWWKTGETKDPAPRSTTCKVKDCTRNNQARGLCTLHYSRLLNYGDPLAPVRKPHGLTKTPEHNAWKSMKQRVSNPRDPHWPDYGGRGITVCERYLKFENFIADLGRRPEGLTLDRKNNEGGYWCGKCSECLVNGWPMNVRWATMREQSNNRRERRKRAASYVT